MAHIVFFFFCFATNIIVTSMLILGGASVMNALTGMDIYAVRASARLDKLRSQEHSLKNCMHCLRPAAKRLLLSGARIGTGP